MWADRGTASLLGALGMHSVPAVPRFVAAEPFLEGWGSLSELLDLGCTFGII